MRRIVLIASLLLSSSAWAATGITLYDGSTTNYMQIVSPNAYSSTYGMVVPLNAGTTGQVWSVGGVQGSSLTMIFSSGGGSGTTVYPASATVSLPLGYSASTGQITSLTYGVVQSSGNGMLLDSQVSLSTSITGSLYAGNVNGLITSTTTLQTNITSVGTATGTIQTQLTSVAAATGTIQTGVNAVASATGTLASSVGTSTASIQSQVNTKVSYSSFSATGIITYNNATGAIGATQVSLSSDVIGQVSLSTGVTSSLPAASIAAGALGAGVIASSLTASGVTANSYTNTNLTVNAEGQITAASNGSAGGGASPLALSVGTARSSPTTDGMFPSPEWIGSVSASSMTITPNPSSFTLQGQIVSSITLASMYGAPTLTGTNFTGIPGAQVGSGVPAANIAGGILGGTVIASSVAATAAIINQSVLQKGSTAYPDFAYINSSATIAEEVLTNAKANYLQTDATGLIYGAQVSPSSGIAAGGLAVNVYASSLTASGVTAGAYTNANITVNAEGQVTIAASGSAGGGGGQSVAHGTGTASGYTGTITSTSTALVIFSSAAFNGYLEGGSTFFITPNFSSITTQGQIVSSVTLASMYGAPTLTGTNFTGIPTTAISAGNLGPGVTLTNQVSLSTGVTGTLSATHYVSTVAYTSVDNNWSNEQTSASTGRSMELRDFWSSTKSMQAV